MHPTLFPPTAPPLSVVAADGHTYERIEIERWFRCARDSGEEIRSPKTNEVLAYSMLAPNHSMRFLITGAIEDEMRNSDAQLQRPQAHQIPPRARTPIRDAQGEEASAGP